MSDEQLGDAMPRPVPPPKGDPVKFGWFLIVVGVIGVLVVVAVVLLRPLPVWFLLIALLSIPNFYSGIKSIRSAKRLDT